MNEKIFSLAVLILIVSVGCNNKELSRAKAAELIAKHYEYPNVEVAVFNMHNGITTANELLIREGYLSSHPGDFQMQITSAGRPYLMPKCARNGQCFATNMRRFKEVTGIKYDNQDKTKATVEYTVQLFNITPFGKQRNYVEGEIVPYTGTIERYDDGWRVTTHSERNYKESDFPDVEEFLEN
ncbi:MAG TPA: hypothetical protein VD908_15795 [Cytophagales bacterium]|nr:hypothetical protein [Cytophagales bacterium]